MHRNLTHFGVWQIDNNFSLLEMGVFDYLRDIIDGPAGNALAPKHLKNLVECSTTNPFTDDVINLGAVGHAVRICLELWIAVHVVAADDPEQPLGHGLDRTGKGDTHRRWWHTRFEATLYWTRFRSAGALAP